MKAFFFLLVYFFINSHSNAQSTLNYLANGSFEENLCCRDSTLPDSVSYPQFFNCRQSKYFEIPSPPPPVSNGGRPNYYTISKKWLGISTTPDLFGSCVKGEHIVDADYSYLTQSYFKAQNGGNFMGLLLLYEIKYLKDNYKEFLETKLKDKLKKGKQYCITLFISCGTSSQATTSDLSIYFSDTLFQRALYFDTNTNVMPLYEKCKPQLMNNSGPINNRWSWRELKWIYNASGNEQFMTIGNFKTDSNTSIYSLPFDTMFDPGDDMIYLLIDNISITELQDANAGRDTTICKGTSTQIGAEQIESIEYSWEPSEGLSNPKIAKPIATPTQTTTYRVTMHQCRDVTDEVTITVTEDCKIVLPKLPIKAPSFLKHKEVLNIKNLPVTNSINIYNIAGQLVKQFTNYTNNETLGNFAEGLYILRINTDTESVVGKLLVVE